MPSTAPDGLWPMVAQLSLCLQRAKSLVSSGKVHDAIKSLDQALEEAPTWGRGWFVLGQCHYRAADFDRAAVCFFRAVSLTPAKTIVDKEARAADSSQQLALAATENLQLSLLRVLPRHAMAWVQDSRRMHTFVQRSLVACKAVLIAGGVGLFAVEAARRAVVAGCARVTAVCGLHLALEVGQLALADLPAEQREKVTLVATLEEVTSATGPGCFDVLVWDWCNCVDARTIDAFCQAKALLRLDARVVPGRLRVRAILVASDALLRLDAIPPDGVRIDGMCAENGAFGVVLPHFAEQFTRRHRTCQLQAPTCEWVALTEPAELFDLDLRALRQPSDLHDAVPALVRVTASGTACAVVTWLHMSDFGGDMQHRAISSGPPAIVSKCNLTDLSWKHAVQHALFFEETQLLMRGDALTLAARIEHDTVTIYCEQMPIGVAGPRAALLPDYHFSMLNDKARNDAYAAGLAAAIARFQRQHGRSPHVLDIGAGSGLLSMCAVHAGAARVTACERHAALAAAAEADIAANGLGDKIRVVPVDSRHPVLAELGPYDIIVSEVFGSDPLSEGVLATLEHAHRCLLAPHGMCVPAAVTIHAALLCTNVDSLDTLPSAYQSLEPVRVSCKMLDVPGARLVSDPVVQFRMPLDCAESLKLHGEMCATTHVHSMDECVDALLYWFSVNLDGTAKSVSTGPADDTCMHWQQTIYRLSDRLPCQKGESVVIQAVFHYDRLNFTVRVASPVRQ